MAVDASPGDSFSELVTRLIDERHTDTQLDASRLASVLHVSRRQLYRHVDGGVAAMIAARRAATAERLLIERPDLDIQDVAVLSGFTDASALRAQFRRHSGVSPSEYRRSTAQRSRPDNVGGVAEG